MYTSIFCRSITAENTITSRCSYFKTKLFYKLYLDCIGTVGTAIITGYHQARRTANFSYKTTSTRGRRVVPVKQWVAARCLVRSHVLNYHTSKVTQKTKPKNIALAFSCLWSNPDVSHTYYRRILKRRDFLYTDNYFTHAALPPGNFCTNTLPWL